MQSAEFTGAVVSIEFRIKINEVRRTVPSFKLLKDSKVYDILFRKSSTIQSFCDFYKLQSLCFQAKKASIPSALLYVVFLCTKKEIFEAYRLEILRLWEQQKTSFQRVEKERKSVFLSHKFFKYSSRLRKSTVTV